MYPFLIMYAHMHNNNDEISKQKEKRLNMNTSKCLQRFGHKVNVVSLPHPWTITKDREKMCVFLNCVLLGAG